MASEPRRRGRPPKSETDIRRNSITFRCNDELWDQLRVSAQENGRSINKEMEERLEQSFSYNGFNINFLKQLFNLSDPIPAVFEIGMLWDRSRNDAERRIRSETKWYASKDKIHAIQEYFLANFRRVLVGIASREQMEATLDSEDDKSGSPL